MGSITTFPIPTTPVSGLTAAGGAPAAGDLFAGVDIDLLTQGSTGSLVKYTWAQLMTSPVLTGVPTIAGGTVTTALSPLTITQTWNNGAITFPGVVVDITNTASVATSKLLDLQVGASSKCSVDTTGKLNHAGDLATGGNAAITGTLGITGATTGTSITASTKLAASTSGVTNGCAVADATTSATTSYAPKGLGVKAYFGSDKAGTLMAGSSDGDAIVVATTGNIILSSGGANMGLRVDTSNNLWAQTGNVCVGTTGKGLQIKSGTNARVGSFILVAGFKSVANTSVTANTVVFPSVSVVGGTQGILSFVVSAGVGFACTSTNAADTCTVNYVLIETIP